ncbi:MAG: hypothetical protein HZB56_19145 [Deltaproteobacteria bacterium]|nr:hypothetical protein [Deltaproteobacteria bacterium]
MAKKKADSSSALDALLAAGDYRAARGEAARLAAEPGGQEAARAAAPRFGPEKGARAAAILGVLLFLAIAFLGLRHP